MKLAIVVGLLALICVMGGCNAQQSSTPVQSTRAQTPAPAQVKKAPAAAPVTPQEAARLETERAMAPVGAGAGSIAKAAQATGISVSQEPLKEFVVYIDKGHRDNHYIPSGFMGDYGDISLNDKYMTNPHGGTTCIQISYSAKKSQGQGWAGIYWQNPQNSWGTKQGGFNLTGITKLTFWARGEKGGEIIQKFMVGGIKGTYSDSVNVETEPITLTPEWKEYTINLAGKDLSYVSGGFGLATNADSNSNGCVCYIDDIKFAADPAMKPEGRKAQEMPFFVYSEKGSVGNHFIPSGQMGDYGDIKLDTGSAESPYEGATCIKITYTNKASQGSRWAGMYWQNPPNNWGAVDAGFNLSKASKVTFWARADKGGEQITEFKVGGIMGEYSDSDVAMIGPVTLNKEWTQYTIDLAGKDMSYVIGGFCWSTNIDMNPEGVVFYLDNIKYE